MLIYTHTYNVHIHARIHSLMHAFKRVKNESGKKSFGIVLENM